jgi:hypothetical protein
MILVNGSEGIGTGSFVLTLSFGELSTTLLIFLLLFFARMEFFDSELQPFGYRGQLEAQDE